MCGICGYLNLSGTPAEPELAGRMAQALAHRGPDGQGVWASGPVALGHRRLAILDLSAAAAQPMVSNNGRFVIAYNGEVYNFSDLRRELETLGHTFRSRTDTEVVLAAYSQWGAASVKRLNGMFAFAIWDAHKRTLFLARDRYGIKPLYYALLDGALVFGSEQKAILEHPAMQREVDLEALLEYFTFQNIFTDRTLLKGIRLFAPAHHATISLDQNSEGMRPVRYWDFDFRPDSTLTCADECSEELLRLLRQAVERQLVSDVEICAYLSGGLDSGGITAIAAAQRPYIKTFTCGFDLSSASGLELTYDERENAEAMSALFKTEHYEMVLKAGDMERCLPLLAWHLEEPRVGQSYPNFYIAQLASKFGKVVLAGSGGDELFGGYPWRYYCALSCENDEAYLDKYYMYWQRLIDSRFAESFFRPIWPDVHHVNTRDIFRSVFHGRDMHCLAPDECINHSLYFEAKTFLHGILVVEDKLSMAHGLETRLPFLDNDLVDFAQRVPVSLKLGNPAADERIDENAPAKVKDAFKKSRDGKRLLRQVMRQVVPQEVTEREKQGFSAPDASWFKGESIEYVRRVIFDHRARMYDYLDMSAVHSAVNEHISGRANRRLFIWSLLNFEWWLRRFLP